MDDPETPKPDGEPTRAAATKQRSETAYPYFGLPVAIAIVQAVRRAGGNEATSAAVMDALGLKKVTDRQWAYGVPAAIQFGLIERVGRGDEGRIKLTSLANRIVLPANDDEARLAKVAAFREPELYSRLLERFAGHPVPAKDGLKNLLHRDFGIVETMASNAADAFLQSLTEAGLVNAQNVVVSSPGSTSPEVPRTEDENKGHKDPITPPGSQSIHVPADFIIYRCKISGGRVIEIPLPPSFTTADMTRLNAFLQTQVDDPEDGPV